MAMAGVAAASKPAPSHDLGSLRPNRCSVATLCPHRASLPQRALRRQDPRQEPGALIPHAGICPGGRPQGRSLPGLPANPPDKAAAAEAGEERERTKGNTAGETRPGRSAGSGVSSELGRVRQIAQRDKEARFTALLHHVSLERLVIAYWDLSPKASPGVDGVTWADYGQDLVANLRDLHDRVHSGRYRASPSRRAYIPKADGRLRPLGIATLEDKIVQRAVVEVLNAVYEADFLGFSYGFRPGRGPHDALDALAAGIYRKKVNWVLDADIRDFFGQLDRNWLRTFLRHRIADKRVLRLIGRWLAAGVIEDGQRTESEKGSPQGGLCNAFHNDPSGSPFSR